MEFVSALDFLVYTCMHVTSVSVTKTFSIMINADYRADRENKQHAP